MSNHIRVTLKSDLKFKIDLFEKEIAKLKACFLLMDDCDFDVPDDIAEFMLKYFNQIKISAEYATIQIEQYQKRIKNGK